MGTDKKRCMGDGQVFCKPHIKSSQVFVIIGGEQKHQSIKLDGVCTCLCSSMGTGGGYIPLLVQELNND